MGQSYVRLTTICVVLAGATSIAAQKVTPAAEWKAGLAAVAVTPDEPIWMAGYANRNRPSEGKVQDLYARALAVEDGGGGRAVLVSIEVLGLTRALADSIAGRVQQKHGLDPSRLFLLSTHTHTGPVLQDALRGSYELDPEQSARVEAYTRRLQDQVVDAVGRALASMSPAHLAFGTTQATFGVNRRVPSERGFVFGVNPNGPAHHEVPVLRITSPDGQVRGLVFGYACHNTTLTGDFYQISGDYSGFASAELERMYPKSVALFVMGAGADINPEPRGTLEHARTHGETLARAVDGLVRGSLTPVAGRLAVRTRSLDLPLTVPSAEELRRRSTGDNRFRERHAARTLDRINRGELRTTVPYRIAGLRLGRLSMIALPGEVVVDYVLRLKREHERDPLWVAAYAHDVPAYIPSERILREGGYEADFSMIYYDQPGPFAPGLEDKIVTAVHDLLKAIASDPVRSR